MAGMGQRAPLLCLEGVFQNFDSAMHFLGAAMIPEGSLVSLSLNKQEADGNHMWDSAHEQVRTAFPMILLEMVFLIGRTRNEQSSMELFTR